MDDHVDVGRETLGEEDDVDILNVLLFADFLKTPEFELRDDGMEEPSMGLGCSNSCHVDDVFGSVFGEFGLDHFLVYIGDVVGKVGHSVF